MSIKKMGIAGVIGTLLLAGNASAEETLRVLLEGHSTSDSIKALLPEFEKETGIKVQAEIVPYNDLPLKPCWPSPRTADVTTSLWTTGFTP